MFLFSANSLINSMDEKKEFDSPLDEGIADMMRSSNMFFKHLDNPNGKKESYFPLPTRFSKKLEEYPKCVQINVTECMREIYRSGQTWVKEQSFHFLTSKGIDYPYKELVDNGAKKLSEIYSSYWLRDMIYLDEKTSKSLRFKIQTVYDTDIANTNNTTVRMITDILCDIGADGHIGFSITNVEICNVTQ